MAITDAAGLPIAACLASASIHEVKLAKTALDSLFIAGKPEKFIGDKAYDSDILDNDLLEKQGVEMIAPYRRNRTKPKTQDGRKLRRYNRRWKVERLFAWLLNYFASFFLREIQGSNRSASNRRSSVSSRANTSKVDHHC